MTHDHRTCRSRLASRRDRFSRPTADTAPTTDAVARGANQSYAGANRRWSGFHNLADAADGPGSPIGARCRIVYLHARHRDQTPQAEPKAQAKTPIRLSGARWLRRTTSLRSPAAIPKHGDPQANGCGTRITAVRRA